jgi:hypothetical protein
MAKVRQDSGEADSMVAHVMEEHAALQAHLEAIIEPTITPDSQVRTARVTSLHPRADVVLFGCTQQHISLRPSLSHSSSSQFALDAAEEYDPVRELRRQEAEDIRIAKELGAERATRKMLKQNA